ncbi:MAG: hypothetical protein BWX99_02797 [Deltaproteobacteria bacterium ADurb.Bin151]|nr:MAG: hypothetical protein BWX99_02797 [Deltaproteobacteria bacterium ADurb.Bin151]
MFGGEFPVHHKRVRHQPHFSQRAGSEPEIMVFTIRAFVQFFVLKPRVFQSGPPDYGRRVDKIIVLDKFLVGDLSERSFSEIQGKGVAAVILILFHDEGIASQKDATGMIFQKSYLLFQFFGQPDVVIIKKSDIGCAPRPDRPVAWGCRGSRMITGQVMKTAVL